MKYKTKSLKFKKYIQKRIINFFNRHLRQKSLTTPIFIFTYHKVGTILLHKIFAPLCTEFNWVFQSIAGNCNKTPYGDVVIFQDSLVDFNKLPNNYKAIHLIRDPRDIIVSGFFYHRKCYEKWCLNCNFSVKNKINNPTVPFPMVHLPKKLKLKYINDLNGESYQKKLLSLDYNKGLLFEMEHYAKLTIQNMSTWNYKNDNILEIRFEDLMSNYEIVLKQIFKHFDFSETKQDTAMKLSKKHNLKTMSSKELKKNKHILSRKTTRWKKYFKKEHKEKFKLLFPKILIRLGYEKSDKW